MNEPQEEKPQRKDRIKPSPEFAKIMRDRMKMDSIGVRELGRRLDIEATLVSRHIGSDTRPPKQRPNIDNLYRYAGFLGLNPLYVLRLNGYRFPEGIDSLNTLPREMLLEFERMSPAWKQIIPDLLEHAFTASPIKKLSNGDKNTAWVNSSDIVKAAQDYQQELSGLTFKNGVEGNP